MASYVANAGYLAGWTAYRNDDCDFQSLAVVNQYKVRVGHSTAADEQKNQTIEEFIHFRQEANYC